MILTIRHKILNYGETMKHIVCLLITLTMWVQGALANCYSNLERDMPLIELTACFNGSCVDDVLLLACGGTLGFNAKFQSGFKVECTAVVEGTGYNKISQPGECSYFIGDYRLSDEHTKLLSCTPKGSDDYGCNWFPVNRVE